MDDSWPWRLCLSNLHRSCPFQSQGVCLTGETCRAPPRWRWQIFIGFPNAIPYSTIQYKLATVVCRSLNGTAPVYSLSSSCRPLTVVWHAVPTRLWSSLTHQLDVRQSQCATVGYKKASASWSLLSQAPSSSRRCGNPKYATVQSL